MGYRRSGFRLRASATLTPAKRLKLPVVRCLQEWQHLSRCAPGMIIRVESKNFASAWAVRLALEYTEAASVRTQPQSLMAASLLEHEPKLVTVQCPLGFVHGYRCIDCSWVELFPDCHMSWAIPLCYQLRVREAFRAHACKARSGSLTVQAGCNTCREED
jgi:hypothetical protein